MLLIFMPKQLHTDQNIQYGPNFPTSGPDHQILKWVSKPAKNIQMLITLWLNKFRGESATFNQNQAYYMRILQFFVLIFLQNQLPMIQESIQQYDVENYEFGSLSHHKQHEFCLKNFFEELEVLKSPEIRTFHTDNLMESSSLSDLRSQGQNIKCQLPQIQNDNQATLIECGLNALFELRKSKKGRQKERKNISQIFKSETTSFLNIQIKIGILSQQNSFQAKKFKQETCSMKSFIQLLKCQKVKQKLLRFYHSPDFVQSIMKNRRLSIPRKIQVIKHLNSLTKILNEPSS